MAPWKDCMVVGEQPIQCVSGATHHATESLDTARIEAEYRVSGGLLHYQPQPNIPASMDAHCPGCKTPPASEIHPKSDIRNPKSWWHANTKTNTAKRFSSPIPAVTRRGGRWG